MEVLRVEVRMTQDCKNVARLLLWPVIPSAKVKKHPLRGCVVAAGRYWRHTPGQDIWTFHMPVLR